MKNVVDITAAEILAIPVDKPERLFTGDITSAKKEYRSLAGHWQPRTEGEDGKVMAHINVLYDLAVEKLITGKWASNSVLRLRTLSGAAYEMRYLRRREFELGAMYIGDRVVSSHIEERANMDLVRSAIRIAGSFKYADTGMRKEASRYLPEVLDLHEVNEGCVFVVQKDSDQILLRDVLEHCGGKIDAKHVAWICSSLYALTSYFQYAGIVHNHISPDTYYIAPASHSGALLGGWWYAANRGEKLTAVPQRTAEYGPSAMLKNKKADPRSDLEMIKATARELLGDIGGSRLSADKSIPAPLVAWSRQPAGDNAVEEYAAWFEKVLPQSFGARRFIEMKLTASDVYS